jgi:hypothetical protein
MVKFSNFAAVFSPSANYIIRADVGGNGAASSGFILQIKVACKGAYATQKYSASCILRGAVLKRRRTVYSKRKQTSNAR